MFLGLKDGFTPVCDNIGLFYGIKEIEYDNSGVAPNPEVFFNPTDLESTVRIPVIGDLILNKDGCFYRIKNIEDESYKTERLTL
jgi:hypothetical protein